VRLTELNNLSPQEGLNIVNHALKGFHQIYKSRGVVLIKDSMIGMNRQNNVKVWMNPNFAVNEIEKPPISYEMLPEQEKENTMVANVIELVNWRTRKEHQWTDFVEQSHELGRTGFEEAIKLSEMYLERAMNEQGRDGGRPG
jgi:hypothetical protein